MSKIVFLLISICMLATAACNKISNKRTTLVRDCTGTYIKYDGLDYHVCNTEKTDAYTNGSTVKASFKKIKDCNGTAKNAITCAMLHDNNGWIEVVKISGN